MEHLWVPLRCIHAFQNKWNLEVLERGKLENPEKNLLEQEAREKTKNKLNPHIGVDAGIWTLATLVGGKCFLHYTTLINHWYIKIHTWPRSLEE